MYANSAYNAYTENYIGIESPYKLIEMLYEGVLRFNAQAKRAIKDNDIEKRVYWTNRSIAVLAELKGSLDFKQGNVAKYLDGLYDYQIKLLTEAGIENSLEKLEECTNVFKGLLEAWRETTDVA
ncbi:flagellar export chaperone FliS [Sulfurimonas paralvinellae]|uniref:Flagellar export chaperone FliS n=1 Tax=Sulfurimonas paralvinellae TaxID=317658 RepID=A0A7M1B585_9BACT|nr:flagellar export chaperone FliS [Sulfurimonas paralvinellae]QOP44889.1 flagellar export chaperone FliS [Sulfurimonas paralvinellae]